MHLRNTGIRLLSGGMFYKYQFHQVCWLCCSGYIYSYWFYVYLLSISKKGMLKPPVIIVDLSIFLSNILGLCFMYYKSLLLGIDTFKIFTVFGIISSFVIMQCPCSSLRVFLVLKSTLTEINVLFQFSLFSIYIVYILHLFIFLLLF